ARARFPQIHLRQRLRSDAIPHADLRLRHGADHDLETARPGRHARAVRLLQGAPHDSRQPRQGRPRMTAGRAAPVLRVEHLTMRFGGLVAVDDLSFSAARADITALICPNGAGKTTVFSCITGFYKPTEGRIALAHGDGPIWDEIETVTDRGARRLHRGGDALFLLERMPDYLVTQQARVARTFQNIRLFSGMTVFENMLVAQHNTLMAASG